jgi:VanZ family protein
LLDCCWIVVGLCFLNILGTLPLFIYLVTQTMHMKSKTHNSIAMFFLKTLYIPTLAGFEPGSDVSEADAMSTVLGKPPGHCLIVFKFLSWKILYLTYIMYITFLYAMSCWNPWNVIFNPWSRCFGKTMYIVTIKGNGSSNE